MLIQPPRICEVSGSEKYNSFGVRWDIWYFKKGPTAKRICRPRLCIYHLNICTILSLTSLFWLLYKIEWSFRQEFGNKVFTGGWKFVPFMIIDQGFPTFLWPCTPLAFRQSSMYPFCISTDEHVPLKFLMTNILAWLIIDIFNNRHTTAFENDIHWYLSNYRKSKIRNYIFRFYC